MQRTGLRAGRRRARAAARPQSSSRTHSAAVRRSRHAESSGQTCARSTSWPCDTRLRPSSVSRAPGKSGSRRSSGTARPAAPVGSRCRSSSVTALRQVELAAPRPPQRLEAGAGPDQLAERVRERAHVEAGRARSARRRADVAVERPAARRRRHVTGTGCSATGSSRRASAYARGPPTFFAEKAGGICRYSPRSDSSARSTASRVGRRSDRLTSVPVTS